MDTHRGPLRSAAFGATPGADVFHLLSDAPGAGLAERWLAAVALGGQGRYAAAATLLRAMMASRSPLWVSLAASTLASHRRQLGAHAAARALDAVALRNAVDAKGGTQDPDGVDTAGARTDALVGLTADAIGLGELATAGRLLTAAEHAVRVVSGDGCQDTVRHSQGRWPWRAAVRLCWVRAELALATGDPHAALAPARLALERAAAAGAVRHAAKSRLVLAVALSTTGDPSTAARMLRDLVRLANDHHLVPLRWPAEMLLGELNGGPEGRHHVNAASSALRLVLKRADSALRTAAQSSRWVPSEVLRTDDSAERSSAGEIPGEICTGLCQGSTPRDR